MRGCVSRFLVLALGLVFVVVGLILGVGVAGAARAAAERAARLEPIGARQLALRGAGEAVLVEGVVSKRNPARFRDFVAYIREEYRGEDDDGDATWAIDERVTPPLLIEAAGVIQVANSDYQLQGRQARWQESGGLAWNGFTDEGTKRYAGLRADDPVMSIGAAVRGREGVELQAELIYAGTRADYIAEQRGIATWLPWIGLSLGGVGLLLIAIGVVRLLRGR